MVEHEYEATWQIPGLLIVVKETTIKNYNVQIFYNSGTNNYVLFIQSKNRSVKPYEKHFIISAEEAWNEALKFINIRTSKQIQKRSISSKILKFLKRR